MIIKSILKELKGKKIGLYIKNLGQHGHIRGNLKDITNEIVVLKAKHNKLIYIPISEIVVVVENDAEENLLNEKLDNIALISSTT